VYKFYWITTVIVWQPVPRVMMKFGDGAFSVTVPVMWNTLPAAVHHADSLHSFKCRLKSHFSACFNDWQCNALQIRFHTWWALSHHLLLLLLHSTCIHQSGRISVKYFF